MMSGASFLGMLVGGTGRALIVQNITRAKILTQTLVIFSKSAFLVTSVRFGEVKNFVKLQVISNHHDFCPVHHFILNLSNYSSSLLERFFYLDFCVRDLKSLSNPLALLGLNEAG